MQETVQKQVALDSPSIAKAAAEFGRLGEELYSQSLRDGERGGYSGYCSHACGQAEKAIFEALNCLSAYLKHPEAQRLVSNWRETKAEAGS